MDMLAGRTRTRSGAGKPIRWAETWVQKLKDSHGIENLTCGKEVTRERAQLVETMLRYGRFHGEDVLEV